MKIGEQWGSEEVGQGCAPAFDLLKELVQGPGVFRVSIDAQGLPGVFSIIPVTELGPRLGQ